MSSCTRGQRRVTMVSWCGRSDATMWSRLSAACSSTCVSTQRSASRVGSWCPSDLAEATPLAPRCAWRSHSRRPPVGVDHQGDAARELTCLFDEPALHRIDAGRHPQVVEPLATDGHRRLGRHHHQCVHRSTASHDLLANRERHRARLTRLLPCAPSSSSLRGYPSKDGGIELLSASASQGRVRTARTSPVPRRTRLQFVVEKNEEAPVQMGFGWPTGTWPCTSCR